MFGKNKSIMGGSDPSKMETLIGPTSVFQGTIASKGTIRVDGKIEGGITEAAHVIIGEDGEVHGDVNAQTVVVGGSVVGNISAPASLEILSGAKIHGDIKTAALQISEGATFEGNCTMIKEKGVIEMEVNKAAAGGRR